MNTRTPILELVDELGATERALDELETSSRLYKALKVMREKIREELASRDEYRKVLEDLIDTSTLRLGGFSYDPVDDHSKALAYDALREWLRARMGGEVNQQADSEEVFEDLTTVPVNYGGSE